MQIHEPMTMATDYLLAALAAGWGIRLVRAGMREAEMARKLWGAFFLATAVAAITGGTYHGFRESFSTIQLAILWKTTVMAIGVASFLVLIAIARARFSGVLRVVLILVASGKLAFYLVWMSAHDDFLYVILDYAPAMLFVLVVEGWLAVNGERSSRWITAGIAVSFIAAGIQASGFSLHRSFNHNDLYHVVQIAGLYLLYRGGMGISGSAGPGERK